MTESSQIVQRARSLSVGIKDDISLQSAVDFCLSIRRKRKEWEKYNENEKNKIKELKKAFDDRVRQVDEPLERAERDILTPAISAFRNEQERERRRQEELLLAQQRKREEDARLAHAAELEKTGQKEQAEKVLDTPIPVAPVIIPKQKVDGGSFRTDWDYSVMDISLIPREYMVPDFIKIRSHVRQFKDASTIPGILVQSKQVLISGR